MRMLSAIALLGTLAFAVPSQPPAPGYRILVASESGDIVSQLVWDGTTLTTAKVVPVGVMPADIDGPHNVTVGPDHMAWYVTIAHGTPYGSLWKLASGTDSLLGRAPVEMFPTTIALTPDGALAFVANSDFHGDHPRVNVVTIVQTATKDIFAYAGTQHSRVLTVFGRDSSRSQPRSWVGRHGLYRRSRFPAFPDDPEQ